MIDDVVSAFNGLMLLLLAVPLLWVAVSPSFKTGIVLTAGVGAMGLAAAICGAWELNGIDPWELERLARAQAIGLGGLAVCAVRLAVAGFAVDAPSPRRRKTDWADLEGDGRAGNRERV